MDPGTGRFLSQDPIALSSGDSNFYRYVGNDSPNLTDPKGQSGWNRFFGGLRLVGGLIQAVGGTAFAVITSETGVGAVAGGVVAVKGLDDAWAGAQQLWTGQTTQTYTYQGVQALTGSSTAATIVDVGIDLAGAPITGAGLSSLSELGSASETASAFNNGGVLDDANYAQSTFSNTFSADGKFAGQTVNEVAAQLQSGELSASDVPIEYINRDGNTLILNTRSSQALEQAGIPPSEWNAVDVTGRSRRGGAVDGSAHAEQPHECRHAHGAAERRRKVNISPKNRSIECLCPRRSLCREQACAVTRCVSSIREMERCIGVESGSIACWRSAAVRNVAVRPGILREPSIRSLKWTTRRGSRRYAPTSQSAGGTHGKRITT